MATQVAVIIRAEFLRYVSICNHWGMCILGDNRELKQPINTKGYAINDKPGTVVAYKKSTKRATAPSVNIRGETRH